MRYERVGALLDDAFHDDGGGEPTHTGQGGEVGVAQGLVGGDVGGGHAQQVVGVAEEPFGVADLGDLGQVALEVGDRGRVLSVHRHLDQDLEAETDGGWVDNGAVATDRPDPFQLPQSPVAGRHAEPDRNERSMGELLDYLPIAAAAFAIPQFLPQLRKLRATNDTAGVSWSWATLTSVNNAAWFAYFAASAYWAALVPATSATLLAGMLAIMLAQRGQARARPAVLISGWVTLLVAGFAVAGRGGLGTLLTVAFILQVTPSLWTAYRSAHLSGVAAGTWLLILGELSCWTIFGLHQSDPRLLTLGVTGVTASALMLARIRHTRRAEPLRRADAHADSNWSARVSAAELSDRR